VEHSKENFMLIARQAIFNNDMTVYGYELLFRSGYQSSQYDGISAVQATATVLDGLYESGINKIVEDKLAFINCDAAFIMSDTLELISPDRLVIEVLEDVEPSEELIDKLNFLKQKGYKIALDDFYRSIDIYPIVPLADIIKFDIMATPLDTIQAQIERAITQKKVLLAEKVETKEEFQKAKSMGFELFQGYFFSKPSIIGKSNSHTTKKAQFTRIISELHNAEPSYQTLSEIIQTDASLSYRILSVSSKRAGNDPLYSIKNALMYMGFREIELWINIMMMREFSSNKPRELMKLALVRSKFAEEIAAHSSLKKLKQEASMLGLLSIIDAMLDQTFEVALKDLALPASITEALIDNTGTFKPLCELIRSYEKGDWEMVAATASSIHIKMDILAKDYIDAVNWAKDIMSKI
jgi:EAL and modified HD-GYP domain-containing signal transduction protein